MNGSQSNKKFKPQAKPLKENKVNSIYRTKDQNNQEYFAKFFYEKKLIDYNIFESAQYNQTVLTDLSDQIYPEHFLEIKYTYSMSEGYIFITEPYSTTLQSFLKSKVIEEKQAMKIFQQVVKAVYSLYNAGFWHRNIRPEHFVKVGEIWKLQSLVFNQQYKQSKGVQSQYLWDPAYQPPQLYNNQNVSEQQLDQMIVWNLGSLLIDILLSHHKLKDKNILDKFKDQPFTFKAIGVKKEFSNEIKTLLEKMLHYNKSQRMKIVDVFSNETISKQLSKMKKKNLAPNMKVYVSSGNSSHSKFFSKSSNKAQEILGIRQMEQEKEQFKEQYLPARNMKTQNRKQMQNNDETYKKIKKTAEKDMNTIIQQKTQQSQVSVHNRKLSQLMKNSDLIQAIQPYKCYHDKCEMLIIASEKLERVANILTTQLYLLNKYAITFSSLILLDKITESINCNLNFLELEPNLWSKFQQSAQFKQFKKIANFKRQQRKNMLTPLRQTLQELKCSERNLLKNEQIQDFIHCNYKLTDFEYVKVPYRKILKYTYDAITNTYNQQKTTQLAKIGMYITYCMTIDKIYIQDDIKDNFEIYFKYMKVPATNYIPLNLFQQYLQSADKKTLVMHSGYILKKYFFKKSKYQ